MSIGINEIRQAAATLQEYKRGKANLENRIVENEQWFKMRHWQHYRRGDGGKLPSSGWLFNAILNKHADAMDHYPEPAVLPREASDEQTAKLLSQILPAILEKNNYEQVYSDAWWYKLKHGTSVKGVFWDSQSNDIAIRKVDLLGLFWEPGITDFQQSENLFHVELVNNSLLADTYPHLKGKLGSGGIDISKYIYDENIDTSRKSAVVDWYYKKNNAAGKAVLHYCKFVGEHLLFASENDPVYADEGFYRHGLYPFVPDILYREEGMPVGFGLIDAMKDAQESIDELDSNIQFNARLIAKPRFLTKAGSGVNLAELADYTRDFVEVAGDPATAFMQLPVQSLDVSVINYRNMKIQELKETSGNRDFNQGGSVSGVTAASAISMLQEAGNKISRDAIKASYRAFCAECKLIVELIRQFYDENRVFRICGSDGSMDFVQFNNAAMQAVDRGSFMGIDLGSSQPDFDIKISAQKQSPFNQIAHNQFVLELYEKGFFQPQLSAQASAAVRLMEFEGKQKLLSFLSENAGVSQEVTDGTH